MPDEGIDARVAGVLSDLSLIVFKSHTKHVFSCESIPLLLVIFCQDSALFHLSGISHRKEAYIATLSLPTTVSLRIP